MYEHLANSKRLYGDFCQRHALPLQFQPWWWDAIYGADGWNVCLYKDAADNVYGAWPYAIQRRWGLSYVTQAPFSSYAGPWIVYPDNPEFKRHSRYTHDKAVLEGLIAQLPKLFFFRQNAHPNFGNALPLLWAGFNVSPRYTYIIPAGTPLEKLWENVKSNRRAKIRRAEARLLIRRQDERWMDLYALHQKTARRKGFKTIKDAVVFQRLQAALFNRGKAALFTACLPGDEETLCAALLLCFDQKRASALLAAANPVYASENALDALYWEALRFSTARDLTFDFEGSMAPGVEHSYRSFGGELTAYWTFNRRKTVFGR